MAEAAPDILAINRGTITAPAGCGKTHLIAEALTRHSETKPILVLTHTNAGVVALRGRLDRAGVPSRSYRLSTIDGWAMRLISNFPMRSGHDTKILELKTPKTDYPAIRVAAWNLLKAGHIADVLKASYARLIVDEYQDCSVPQHAIVYYTAQSLPTCVLGDPMQAIFGFQGNALADWENQVCKHFPLAGQLANPWRWTNAGNEGFGRWLLDARERLRTGQGVDFQSCPEHVHWAHLDGTEDHKKRLQAALVPCPAPDGRVLIIGESTSPTNQRKIASQTPGAVVVESVDLKDLVAFAAKLDLNSQTAFAELVGFASDVMTNLGGPQLVQRIGSLQAGTAHKPPDEVEAVALQFCAVPSRKSALDLLVEMNRQQGVRVHRPAVLRSCMTAFRNADDSPGNSFYDAVVAEREKNRLIGRPLPKRAVGSTLLLKGLEADISVVLHADDLDARNLYVAITRGASRLVICSKSATLTPAL
jgi:AAA domain